MHLDGDAPWFVREVCGLFVCEIMSDLSALQMNKCLLKIDSSEVNSSTLKLLSSWIIENIQELPHKNNFAI